MPEENLKRTEERSLRQDVPEWDRITDFSSPWEGLAFAVVLTAAKDYRRALRRLKWSPRADAMRCVKECEAFFRSGLFEVLTELDPEYLMDRIRREVSCDE